MTQERFNELVNLILSVHPEDCVSFYSCLDAQSIMVIECVAFGSYELRHLIQRGFGFSIFVSDECSYRVKLHVQDYLKD